LSKENVHVPANGTTNRHMEESRHMDFIKKEWLSLVQLICLIVIIICLVVVSLKLTDLQQQNAKIMSTFGSIESVTINTETGLNGMTQKIDKIDNNVTFLIKKVRRR
jgi:hypothetical protein